MGNQKPQTQRVFAYFTEIDNCFLYFGNGVDIDSDTMGIRCKEVIVAPADLDARKQPLVKSKNVIKLGETLSVSTMDFSCQPPNEIKREHFKIVCINPKVYTLMVSVNFPKNNFNAGLPTNFEKLIGDGVKIHTIRGNFDFWQKRAAQIQENKAYLSLRKWEGIPYKSKQIEFAAKTSLAVQSIEILPSTGNVIVDGKLLPKSKIKELAANDGFTSEAQFWDWFGKESFKGAILHFTDFRY